MTRRSNKKQQTKDGDETDKDGDKDDKDELSLTKKIGDDMDIMDNTECKFNVNSFKLVYVVNSENYLYKRMALRRAQQVRTKKKSVQSLDSRDFQWLGSVSFRTTSTLSQRKVRAPQPSVTWRGGCQPGGGVLQSRSA